MEERRLSLTYRNSFPDELDEFHQLDALPPFNEFKSVVKSSEVVAAHSIFVSELKDDLYLFSINSDGNIAVRILMSPNFSIKCFKYNAAINIRDLLGYQPTLKTWSQLNEVIVRCKNGCTSIEDELIGSQKSFKRILQLEGLEIYDPTIHFLLGQLKLALTKPQCR